jgi:hypothetical protein
VIRGSGLGSALAEAFATALAEEDDELRALEEIFGILFLGSGDSFTAF